MERVEEGVVVGVVAGIAVVDGEAVNRTAAGDVGAVHLVDETVEIGEGDDFRVSPRSEKP